MSRANKLYENINADMFITKLDNYDSEITLKGDCNMADNNMKIGSRRLTDKELKVLLKDYKNIYEQIDSIRDNAWELKNKIENDEYYRKIVKEEPEFIKHHNNVFSILGTRGSGKSSILISIKYTIMNQIIKRKKGTKNTLEYDSKGQKKSYNIESYDTVLPIIAPQDMDEDSESLGWIIGFFEKEVEKSEKLFIEDRRIFDYQNENCNLCSNKRINTNPLKEAYNVVKEAYFKRKKDYKNRLMDVNSDSDYIDLKGETLCQDVSLAKKFKGFIDEFVKYKSVVAKRKYNESVKEPLVFIFFDDVDISTKKCIDVLETIIRYLAHSNIVTFVSGNYKTFEETITLRYLEQDGLLDKELLEINFTNSTNDLKNNAMRIRKKLTYDYLKKVLSPALRYHLTKIKDEDKYNFAYRIVEDENEEKISEKDDGVQLYKLIEEAFGLPNDNFMKYELVYPTGDKKYEVMNKFFMPFDNKPRGLINIYYYLNSMWDKVKSDIEKEKNTSNEEEILKEILKKIWTESELNKFLTIIITSNSRLDIYRKTIKDVIKIKKNYDGEIDVDVDYFKICEGEKFKTTIVDENTRLQVLILGLFFDGLISNLNNKKSDIFIERYDYDEYKVVCDYLESALSKGDDILFRLIYKTNRVFEILYFYDKALNYSYNNNYMDINNRNFVEYIKNIEKKVKENDKDIEKKIKEDDKYIKLDEKQLIDLINKKIVIEELESFSNSLEKIDTNSFEYIKNYLTKNIMKENNIYKFREKNISVDIDLNYIYENFEKIMKMIILKNDNILKNDIDILVYDYYFRLKNVKVNANCNYYENKKLKQNIKLLNKVKNLKHEILKLRNSKNNILEALILIKKIFIEIFNKNDNEIKNYINNEVNEYLDNITINRECFDDELPIDVEPTFEEMVLEIFYNDNIIECDFNLKNCINSIKYDLNLEKKEISLLILHVIYYIINNVYNYVFDENKEFYNLYEFDDFIENIDSEMTVTDENYDEIQNAYESNIKTYVFIKISENIFHGKFKGIIENAINKIKLNFSESSLNILDINMGNINYILNNLESNLDEYISEDFKYMRNDLNLIRDKFYSLFKSNICIKEKDIMSVNGVITESEFDEYVEEIEVLIEEKKDSIYNQNLDLKNLERCYKSIVQKRSEMSNLEFNKLSILEKIIIEKEDSILIDFSKELNIDDFVTDEYIVEKANIICLLYELIEKNRDKISLDNLKFQLSKFDRELHSEFEKDKNKKLSNDELMKIFVYMCFFVIVYKEENKKSKAKEYEIFAKKLRELLGNEYNEQFMELLD